MTTGQAVIHHIDQVVANAANKHYRRAARAQEMLRAARTPRQHRQANKTYNRAVSALAEVTD